MAELWLRLKQLPDLSLNKYSSLDGRGVDGVLEKHISFLRQLNRKGIVSGLSFHLFYLYLVPNDVAKDTPGHRLSIFLMVRGENEALDSFNAMVKAKATPLSPFYDFETSDIECVLKQKGMEELAFSTCSFLTKSEVLLPAVDGEGEDYYMIREWDMNDEGRLFNMCKMMEALEHSALFRVDLYPVEKSISLREALKKPMSILRKRQDERGYNSRRDYDGKDVLDSYEDIIENYDSNPHFIANVMAFADSKEDAVSVLDAAGSESLHKGKYSIATFRSQFNTLSFLSGDNCDLQNIREGMVVKKSRPGLVVCKENTSTMNLNYLPTLFTLDEIAPYFRFPALYDGEFIQMAKETTPGVVNKNGALFLGTDNNGYDVFFPLELLPKHAFVAGVPGSGKTNTMLHITSSLWKEHGIPFLVLEPAKKEYRALLNDTKMKALYLFSPNADMSFPLHINPFEMPKGTLIAEHISNLGAVFEGAFPLEPPAPFILDKSIEAVYRKLGWLPDDKYTGEEKNPDGTPKRLPTISMLFDQFEKEMQATSYGEETKGNLKSFLQVRIGSLLRREMGDVFDVPKSTIPPEKWLEIPAVVELESMGAGPANFLTLMLCSLIRETLKVDPKRESTAIKGVISNDEISFVIKRPDFFEEAETYSFSVDRLCGDSDGLSFVVESQTGKSSIEFANGNFTLLSGDKSLRGYYVYDEKKLSFTLYWGNKDVRHVIFIEEAHNLIGPEAEVKSGGDANPKQAATAFVVKMLAEVRALQESIVIADQLPTVMAQEVLKNTGLKIGLKITSADDRSLLGSTMAANGIQLEQMAVFSKGEALIFYENLQRPFSMRIKEWCGEIKDVETKKEITTPKDDEQLRNMLCSNDVYKYENAWSARIICKKYSCMLEDTLSSFKSCEVWLKNNSSLKHKYDNLYRYLERIELKQIIVSEERKQKLWDEFNVLCEQEDKVMQSTDYLREPIRLISSYIGWLQSIERLKNGRWSRAGIEEADIVRTDLLESNIIESMSALYKDYTSVFGVNKELKQYEADILTFFDLNPKLNSLVYEFVRVNGKEALNIK